MSQQSSLVGQTLGQYQIVELVGEGGMATIYKAWQPSLKRYVALKVLAPRLSNESEFLKRFHQEAVAAANLKHTHIVTVYDVGVEGDYHYMAMEFIEGTSLQERLRSGQAFTLDEVVDVVSQVGAALDYAHQRGFIHRDIKPANILIESSGRAVLTDFGIVKALSESGVTSALTQAGTIIGTPQYMSPEQVKDELLDHRSDLYSLGIVCFEMLSGQVPFDGTTTHAILYAQVNTPPPPLRKFVGLEVPAPVEAAVNKMLAKDRESRYGSAGEFARDLAQAAAGVWPAGIGGETAVVGHMGGGTAVAGGAAGGVTVPATKQPAGPPTPPPTVRQPGGPPTPVPAVWQPVGPPTPTPVPARRRRSPLALELGIAAGIVLILGIVVAALLLGRWYPLWNAQRALRAGDYARAVEGFSQTLERNPDNAQAIEGLLDTATNLSQDKQFDAAIAAYETVKRVKPQEVRALQGLGRAYEAKGAWGEAAAWYEKWTQVATEDKSAFLALSDARLNLREYERAVAAYERAKALGAGAAGMDAHLGLAYFELAQYNKAAEHLQPAVEQSPEDFQLRRALGLSLYAQGQFEPAAEHLSEALALGAGRSDDELADLDYVLGDCYFEMQDYEQAIHLYEQAQALDPEGRSARAEEARANLDEAYAGLAQSVMGEAILDLDFSNLVTEGGGTYAIARTGQRVKIGGPVRVVEGPWEGSQALVVEEGTENVIQNPSVEVDTSGWTFYSAPSYISRSNERAYSGNYSMKVSGTNESGSMQTSAGSSELMATSAGEVWAASAYVWRDTSDTATAPQLYMEFLDARQARVGISYVLADPEKVDEWQRVVVTGTAPASAAYVWVLCPYLGIPDGGMALVYYDAVQLEQKPYATGYCDGDQGPGYSWYGIPHKDTGAREGTLAHMSSAGVINGRAGSVNIWWQPEHASDVDYHRYLFNLRDGTTDWGYLYWDYGNDSYSFSELLSNAQVFPAGEWQHIVVTWEPGTRKIYVNGVLEHSDSVNPPASIPDTLYIGVRYSRSFYANGSIADFATFDRALSTSEVTALYREGVSASE